MNHTVRKRIIKCLLLLGLGCCMSNNDVSATIGVARNPLVNQRKSIRINRNRINRNRIGPKLKAKAVSVNQRKSFRIGPKLKAKAAPVSQKKLIPSNSLVKMDSKRKSNPLITIDKSTFENNANLEQNISSDVLKGMNAVEHLYVENSEGANFSMNKDVENFSNFLCTAYAKKFDKPLADTFNVKDLERTFSGFFKTGRTDQLDTLLERIGYTKKELTEGNSNMHVYYNTSNPQKNEDSVHGASIFLRTDPDHLTCFYGTKDWSKEKPGSDGKYKNRNMRNSFENKDRIDSISMINNGLEFQNDCFDYVRTNSLKTNSLKKFNNMSVDLVGVG